MADWSRSKGIEKISKYCAYQERCHQEVQIKLKQMGCPWDEAQEILALLIEDGFLNEERYAKAFVKGKFNQNDWGKIKIRHALRGKFIHESLIQQAFDSEIDETDYSEKLRALFDKRASRIEGEMSWKERQKIFAWLQGKGYESEQIIKVLEQRD